MAEKEVFEYTYSAPEQSEVQKIREKYMPDVLDDGEGGGMM